MLSDDVKKRKMQYFGHIVRANNLSTSLLQPACCTEELISKEKAVSWKTLDRWH